MDDPGGHKARWAATHAARMRQFATDMQIEPPPDAPEGIAEKRKQIATLANEVADLVDKYRLDLTEE